MFLQVSVILFTRGGAWSQGESGPSMLAGFQAHTQGGSIGGSGRGGGLQAHSQGGSWGGDLVQAHTQGGSWGGSGPGIPLWWLLLRVVHILLECILFFKKICWVTDTMFESQGGQL